MKVLVCGGTPVGREEYLAHSGKDDCAATMTRRKGEITARMNERDFPHIVELELPPGGFRERRSRTRCLPPRARHRDPPWSRPECGRAVLCSILLPRRRSC